METKPALAALRAVEADLNSVVFERGEAIRVAILALLTRSHALYTGLPGTGKSFMVDQLVARCTDTAFFTETLHPQAPADALLGPLDVAKLGTGAYVRRTAGFLPSADVAFVDEIFKGPPSSLQALLGILNERKLTQDGVRVACPLWSCFGASNEVPKPGELDALRDRFLLAYEVEPLREEASKRARFQKVADAAPKATIPLTAVKVLADAVKTKVKIDSTTEDALLSLEVDVARAGVYVSDRRWTQAANVVRANALLEGRIDAKPEDLTPLSHVLWTWPEDKRKVAEKVFAIALPQLGTALKLLDEGIELHKLALANQGDEATAKASSALRKKSDELDALAKVCGHPRVVECQRRMLALRAEVRKKVLA
jgi:MoxR-like ATPase